MGLLSTIVPLLRQSSVAAAAFYADFAPFSSEWISKNGFVNIEDSLVRMNAIPGPRGDYQLSGTEFVGAFAKEFFYRFSQLPCKRFISVLDALEGVPIEKRETQAKRASRNKFDPYPIGSVIVPEGIVIPVYKEPASVSVSDADEMDSQSTSVVAERKTELIDMRRLLLCRHLRRLAWNFCRDHMMESSSAGRVRTTQKLLMEYSRDGVYRFEFDEKTKQLQLTSEDPDTRFAHEHGEADISLFWWASIYRSDPLLLCTIDSDLLAIFRHFLRECEPTQSVVWEGGLGKNKFYVDLKQLDALIERNLKLPPISWTFFCVLNGTDFVQKDWLTHQIGTPAILKGVQHYAQQIEALWDPRYRDNVTMEQKKDLMKRLLFYIYYTCDGKTKNVFEKMDEPTTTTTTMNKKRQRKFPIEKGQQIIHLSSSSAAVAITTPSSNFDRDSNPAATDWDALYQKLSIAVNNLDRKKELEAKIKANEARKSRKRKRVNAELDLAKDEESAAAAKEIKKLVVTALRPPGDALLEYALVRINFNMKYWTDTTNFKDHPVI